MKDRKFHTDKELKDNYPKPVLPADEAWAEMNKTLDIGMHDPPESSNRSAPGAGKGFFWQYTLIAAVVTGSMWAYYHYNKKTPALTTLQAHKNEKKQAQPIQYDTTKALNTNEQPNDKGIPTNDPVSKRGPAVTNSETQPVNKLVEKDSVTLLHSNNADSVLSKNKVTTTPINDANSIKGAHTNNRAKNNTAKNEKKKQYQQPRRHKASGSLAHSGGARTNNNAGKDKTRIEKKNINNLGSRQNQLNVPGHNRLTPANKYLVSEINIPPTLLPAKIISFIKEPVSIDILNNPGIDSSYLQKMNAIVNDLALQKDTTKSRHKIKDGNKRSTTDFQYGLQWDAAIPVQGTTNYFRGANGNSKPYDIIIPQLWLSKGLNNMSKIFFRVNVNHQYFIGNKEVSSDTSFSLPDSSFHKTFVSKTFGFGATLEYSYSINKSWSAAIGINYSLNRNALLHKQIINLYSRSIVSDSLYGIKKSSADWRYINNSLVLANFESWYAFKKFSLGAAVNLSLSNIPIYDNKKIHPVNAQLFLRWNIKRN